MMCMYVVRPLQVVALLSSIVAIAAGCRIANESSTNAADLPPPPVEGQELSIPCVWQHEPGTDDVGRFHMTATDEDNRLTRTLFFFVDQANQDKVALHLSSDQDPDLVATRANPVDIFGNYTLRAQGLCTKVLDLFEIPREAMVTSDGAQCSVEGSYGEAGGQALIPLATDEPDVSVLDTNSNGDPIPGLTPAHGNCSFKIQQK